MGGRVLHGIRLCLSAFAPCLQPQMKIAPHEPPTTDARKLGAKCDVCPLKGCKPVPPPTPNQRARLVVLGEAPGEQEVDEGMFFVGASGRFLDRRLSTLDIHRSNLHVTNTLLCRPPRKLTPGEWNNAIGACQPRLARELSALRTRWVFATGARALQTITGKKKITPWLGAPLSGKEAFYEWKAIAAYHPAFVLRPKGNAYVPAFEIWLGRAWGFATGQLKLWRWPKLVIAGDWARYLRQLRRDARGKYVSVDIENAPISGRIRCIGVGTTNIAISVPLPPEGKSTQQDFDALAAILADPTIDKVFHNAPHDLAELKRHGWKVRGRVHDTLRAHAICAPQLLHNLALACAIEFHAEAWKAQFQIEGEDKGKTLKRFEKAPLTELLPYNAKDNVMQAHLFERLSWRLRNEVANGMALYQGYLETMLVGIEMTEDGVLADTARFERHKVRFKRWRRRSARKLRLIAKAARKTNWESFKLGSNAEVRDLFFKHLGVTPTRYSEETNQPRLDKKALHALLTSYNPLQATAARALLDVRKWNKYLKTYILGLPIADDGRVHASWREFGAITGRWSSSPNLQNIPKPKTRKRRDGTKKVVVPGLRDIFCASRGAWLLEADYSQLELRIVALLARDPLLLRWYSEGQDIHALNARDLFGIDAPTKEQRDLAKMFVYAVNYGAEAVTVWQNLVLDFPNLTLGLVERLKFMWFKKHPWIVDWQQEELRKARTQGYVATPLLGRREYFHSGKIEPNKVLNFPVQGTGAEIINPAVKKIQHDLKRLNIGGLRMQVHDALIAEVTDVPPAMEIMRKHMEQTITLSGVTMDFPVDFKLGRRLPPSGLSNWGAAEEVKTVQDVRKVMDSEAA